MEKYPVLAGLSGVRWDVVSVISDIYATSKISDDMQVLAKKNFYLRQQ